MTTGFLLLATESAHSGGTLDVPGWVTFLFATLLVLMIAALAFEEKLHAKKSIIVGAFAGVCLITETILGWVLGQRIVPFGKIILPNLHEIDIPVFIPAIDWGVISIILGASLFVEVTSRSGVFTWMAIILTKKSGGDPWKLLLAYGILTVLFSAVLNNVTAMIIVGSLTSVSLTKLNRTDLLLGFLMIEGLLTNVGGLLTLISSVPNIIVGKTAGISFVDFFLVASPYVVIATAATLRQVGGAPLPHDSCPSSPPAFGRTTRRPMRYKSIPTTASRKNPNRRLRWASPSPEKKGSSLTATPTTTATTAVGIIRLAVATLIALARRCCHAAGTTTKKLTIIAAAW